MSGIVNSTGARSGVIGTTVGTPAGGINSAFGTFTDAVNTNSTADTWNTFKSLPAFTPLSTSSNIVVQFFMSAGYAGVNGEFLVRIYETATTTQLFRGDVQISGALQGYGSVSCSWGGVYTNSSTADKTFEFQYYPRGDPGLGQGGEFLTINKNGHTCTFAIMEYE